MCESTTQGEVYYKIPPLSKVKQSQTEKMSFFLTGFYLPLVQTLHFISGLNGSAFMASKWEMRPEAETIEPDNCINSH